MSLVVVCLLFPQRHEHVCSPVVHACMRVLSRGSRPTSRPTPVISRVSPFSSQIITVCLTHTWLWPFIMCCTHSTLYSGRAVACCSAFPPRNCTPLLFACGGEWAVAIAGERPGNPHVHCAVESVELPTIVPPSLLSTGKAE